MTKARTEISWGWVFLVGLGFFWGARGIRQASSGTDGIGSNLKVGACKVCGM